MGKLRQMGFMLLMLMISSLLTAQIKKSPPPKTTDTQIVKEKKDSTFQVKGKFESDTVRARLIMWGDDGTDLKPLLYIEGVIVTKYFIVPNQEPIQQDIIVYDMKWKILNKNDIWQVVKYGR